jgi:hypothetical protein
MAPLSKLAFKVEPLNPGEPQALAVMPLIDGVPLVQLVEAFEDGQAFDVAGGYKGIVPFYNNFGPLSCHYLPDYGEGELDEDWTVTHRALLGCDCGYMSCWALLGTIGRVGDTVTWSGFWHNHRPLRDYSALGPFSFSFEDYRDAVYEVAEPFYTK